MAYNDLREWIAALDKAGELKRITAEVDPILEVTEITDRVSKWSAKNGRGPGGPALLFENVKGHPGHKILTNQFGSERRINLALGSNSLDEIAARIHQMMDVKMCIRDSVLSDVNETARQVARVGRAKRGVGQTLALSLIHI